jgi:hypothetical protein
MENKMDYQIGPINNKKYKISMCKKWIETDSCSYNEKCQFAHGPQELEYWKAKKPIKKNRPRRNSVTSIKSTRSCRSNKSEKKSPEKITETESQIPRKIEPPLCFLSAHPMKFEPALLFSSLNETPEKTFGFPKISENTKKSNNSENYHKQILLNNNRQNIFIRNLIKRRKKPIRRKPFISNLFNTKFKAWTPKIEEYGVQIKKGIEKLRFDEKYFDDLEQYPNGDVVRRKEFSLNIFINKNDVKETNFKGSIFEKSDSNNITELYEKSLEYREKSLEYREKSLELWEKSLELLEKSQKTKDEISNVEISGYTCQEQLYNSPTFEIVHEEIFKNKQR